MKAVFVMHVIIIQKNFIDWKKGKIFSIKFW